MHPAAEPALAKLSTSDRGLGYRSTPTTPLILSKSQTHLFPLNHEDDYLNNAATPIKAKKRDQRRESLDFASLSNNVSPALALSHMSYDASDSMACNFTKMEDQAFGTLNLVESEFIKDESAPTLSLESFHDMELPMVDSQESSVKDETEISGMDAFFSKQSSTETLNDAPTGTPLRKAMSEFDPLATQDWMLRFDTPKVGKETTNAPTKTPVQSLIDDIGPLATPNSIFKYSQRDVDRIKAELQAQVYTIFIKGQFEKEFEVAQLEIQDSETARSQLLDQTKKLKSKLGDAEVQWRNAQGKIFVLFNPKAIEKN